MICGFIYGDSNFGMFSYEFSFPLAWVWWSSSLGLLGLSGICFAFPRISESLSNIASNTKKIAELQEKLLKSSKSTKGYSKPSDAPECPRANGESDQDYLLRVSKRQNFADIPKTRDEPRFPRFRGELDSAYWERVKEGILYGDNSPPPVDHT